MKIIATSFCLFLSAFVLADRSIQDNPTTQLGASEEKLKRANVTTANIEAFNLHNRASMPFVIYSLSNESPRSGLGNLNMDLNSYL